MKNKALVLFFIFFTSLFAANFQILVKDKNGLPVKDCKIEITYLNEEQVEKTIFATTNSKGIATKNIDLSTNQTEVKIKIYTYYWKGESYNYTINQSENSFEFTIPFEQEKIIVIVKDQENKSVEQAVISIYGTNAKTITNEDGIGILYVPKNLKFVGIVQYQNQKGIFTTTDILKNETDKYVQVKIKEGPILGETQVDFEILFLDYKEKPLTNKKIRVTYPENELNLETDENGKVYFKVPQGTNVTIDADIYGYLYNITYDATASRKEKIIIPPVIKIEPLKYIEEEKNCFVIFANISSPMKNLPLKIVFARKYGNSTITYDAKISENGLFFTKNCIQNQTVFYVIASNQYETAKSDEITISLSEEKPKQEKAVSPPEKKEENWFLWGIVVFIFIFLILIVYLSRKQLEPVKNTLAEYARVLYLFIKRRKIS